jgi:hypothetical protein
MTTLPGSFNPAWTQESAVVIVNPRYAQKASPEIRDRSDSAGSKHVHAVKRHRGIKESPQKNSIGMNTVTQAGPIGEKIAPSKVLELPSGTILEVYKKNTFWRKAKVVNVNGVPEIYLSHKKGHAWKTRPLHAFEKSLFLQGASGIPYVAEVGNGESYILITKIPGGIAVLARTDGYSLIYKTVSSAQKKAEWCKAQGVNADVLGAEKVCHIKIMKVPYQVPREGVQHQDSNNEKFMVVNRDEFIKKLNKVMIYSDNTNSEPGLREPGSSHTSLSVVLDTAKSAGGLYNKSNEEIGQAIKEWKDYFTKTPAQIKIQAESKFMPSSFDHLAFQAIALTEMGHHAEAQKIFDKVLTKKKQWDEFYNKPKAKPLSVSDHHAFIKKLKREGAAASELKAAFQKFVDNKGHIRNELEAMAVKQLERFGVPVKKKSEMVNHIMHNMMAQYVPSGESMWSPSETHEQSVQKHLDRLTDKDITNITAKKQADKAAYKKATSNPKTLEDYEKYIKHHGESMLGPFYEEKYHALLKEKSDKEAAEKAAKAAKVAPMTKEVGFHGHYLADKKGLKVFGSHEEATAEAAKLQGNGFNAHPIGKLVKISDKGEGPPKLPTETPKTVWSAKIYGWPPRRVMPCRLKTKKRPLWSATSFGSRVIRLLRLG